MVILWIQLLRNGCLGKISIDLTLMTKKAAESKVNGK